MLETFFYTVLRMDIIASVVACIVLIIRLFLKNAPKSYHYVLWLIVLFCLFNPYTFTQSAVIHYPMTGESPIIADRKNTSVDLWGIPFGKEMGLINPHEIRDTKWYEAIKSALPYIWLTGFFCIVMTNIIQLFLLKRKLISAKPVIHNIYICKDIDIPFVLGFVKPKIYLPSDLEKPEEAFILRHERIHILRKDHLIKLLFLAALALHWFNPFIWWCGRQLNDDMEMSCDEAVIKQLNPKDRIRYTVLILNMAVRQQYHITIEGFGGGNIMKRIHNILHDKKRSKKTYLGVMIAVASVVFCLLTVPQISPSSKGKITSNNNYSLVYPEFYNAVNENIVSIEESQKPPFYTKGELDQRSLIAINTYYEESKKAGFIDMSIDKNFIISSFRG